ncbi:MAG TPA: hypothetical protein VLD67_20665, partial [Vicinamibacterales bacterium]|nr:hypothetical protein [Vicinamibacterales bacterium]
MRLTQRTLFSTALLVLIACTPLHAQTLVWDPNSESDLAGYRVHYGEQSGKYTNVADVGKNTQFQPQGFDWSKRWFFAVQAYNTSGLVSALSTEVEWVPDPVTKITGLTASTGYPLLTGQSTTWTATAISNLGPVEYRFWLYKKAAWVLAQDYSPANAYTWTPQPSDVGEPYTVQVWARTVGAAAQYEAYLSTPVFAVTASQFQLWADVDFPTPPANQVTWTAQLASAPAVEHEYRFMVWSQNSGAWTAFREYATSNQAQWTPASIDKYAVEVWARKVGSSAQYEYRTSSGVFDVSRTPLQMTGLFVDSAFPAPTGASITWTARVKGGMSGPIQYQFWLYSVNTGWKIAQPYGPSSTFRWTTAWDDAGDHVLQVWVRSNGSTAAYEDWRGTGWFTIQKAGLNLTTATLFPAAPGSHVKWFAEAADTSVNFEYRFFFYSYDTASWTLGQPYSTQQTWTWIPTITGSYAVQAHARQVGSTAPFDLYRSSPRFDIAQGPVQVKS